MSQNLIDTARFIIENCEQKLALSYLARRAFLSPTHFQKRFKQFFGLTPKEFQTFCRKKNFQIAIKESDNILDAIYAAGFGSTSRVYENNGKLGIDPKVYKKGGKSETIHFHIAQTQFGKILMAASMKGVCAVEIGQDEDTLLKALENEFPNAILTQASEDEDLKTWVKALCDYLDKAAPRPEIPLDIRGTIFEQKVWKFLVSNAANTTSYSEIAKSLDMPKSARAVANAVASNRIALLIPCHKVLRKDGSLGGYKWGADIKQKLLEAGI